MDSKSFELFEGDLPEMDGSVKRPFSSAYAGGLRTYSAILWALIISLIAVVGWAVFQVIVVQPNVLPTLFIISFYIILIFLISFVSWKIFMAGLLGSSFLVSEDNFVNLDHAVKLASEALELPPPRVYIFQGNGIFDVFMAKRFSRRGLILLTSDMVDTFGERPTTREFMFIIGRQMGLMKAGFFRLWWLRDSLGPIFFPVYSAWSRRVQLTADRYGLMVAGDLEASVGALVHIGAGRVAAQSFSFSGVYRQNAMTRRSFWVFLLKLTMQYPFIIKRIVELNSFAEDMARLGKPGVFKIAYPKFRQDVLFLVHGHDHHALNMVDDFIRQNYPAVILRRMALEMSGALSMPEKLDLLAKEATLAVAILTPDDFAGPRRIADEEGHRARQNVIYEIGLFHGMLGRDRLALLANNNVEIPSDLQGVELLSFNHSPSEKFPQLATFMRSALSPNAGTSLDADHNAEIGPAGQLMREPGGTTVAPEPPPLRRAP